MKEFKIRDGIKDIILDLLERKNIAFLERPKTGKVVVDCSGNEYHKIVTRARCIQKSFDDNLPPDTTYYVDKIEKLDELIRDYPEYEIFLKA